MPVLFFAYVTKTLYFKGKSVSRFVIRSGEVYFNLAEKEKAAEAALSCSILGVSEAVTTRHFFASKRNVEVLLEYCEQKNNNVVTTQLAPKG